jgi:hypothetical protein
MPKPNKSRTQSQELSDWAWEVIESDLAPGTKHVLLTLSLHIGRAGTLHLPPVDTLARQTGLTAKCVARHLTIAQKGGWLNRC